MCSCLKSRYCALAELCWAYLPQHVWREPQHALVHAFLDNQLDAVSSRHPSDAQSPPLVATCRIEMALHAAWRSQRPALHIQQAGIVPKLQQQFVMLHSVAALSCICQPRLHHEQGCHCFDDQEHGCSVHCWQGQWGSAAASSGAPTAAAGIAALVGVLLAASTPAGGTAARAGVLSML